MTHEKKETEDAAMKRNNRKEFYSFVAAYSAAYPGYQPQDAKKDIVLRKKQLFFYV